jgi:hypothetical protein
MNRAFYQHIVPTAQRQHFASGRSPILPNATDHRPTGIRGLLAYRPATHRRSPDLLYVGARRSPQCGPFTRHCMSGYLDCGPSALPSTYLPCNLKIIGIKQITVRTKNARRAGGIRDASRRRTAVRLYASPPS